MNMGDEPESIGNMVKRLAQTNKRPPSSGSRRKSIPPKRRIISPYTSQSPVNSTQRLVQNTPQQPTQKIETKPEVKIEQKFKLHQPKTFGINAILKKISELHQDPSGPIKGPINAKQKPTQERKPTQYLPKTSKPDRTGSGQPGKPDVDDQKREKKKWPSSSTQKIEKLRRSPRKSNSNVFAQNNSGPSVFSNLKLPGRIPKKKKL